MEKFCYDFKIDRTNVGDILCMNYHLEMLLGLETSGVTCFLFNIHKWANKVYLTVYTMPLYL